MRSGSASSKITADLFRTFQHIYWLASGRAARGVYVPYRTDAVSLLFAVVCRWFLSFYSASRRSLSTSSIHPRTFVFCRLLPFLRFLLASISIVTARPNIADSVDMATVVVISTGLLQFVIPHGLRADAESVRPTVVMVWCTEWLKKCENTQRVVCSKPCTYRLLFSILVLKHSFSQSLSLRGHLYLAQADLEFGHSLFDSHWQW